MITRAKHRTQQIFCISRFHCGCIYQQTTHRIHFCPRHLDRGILTGEETIRLPEGMTGRPGDAPRIRGLAMSPHYPKNPVQIRSTESNSIFRKVAIMSPHREEWSEDIEEVGICPACVIDSGDDSGTDAAMCECGDPDCIYRWCGLTGGLHGWWLPHAAGKTAELGNIADRDIFAHGAFSDQDGFLQAVLKEESAALERGAIRKAAELIARPDLPRWIGRPTRRGAGNPEPSPRLLKAAVRIHVLEQAHNAGRREPEGIQGLLPLFAEAGTPGW